MIVFPCGARSRFGGPWAAFGGMWLALWLCAAQPAAAQDGSWPGWRGDGSGVSTESDLPVEWHPLAYRWRTPIDGTGSSSPIIVGSRVFVTTSVERAESQATVAVLRTVAAGTAAIVALCLLIAVIRRYRHRGGNVVVAEEPSWLRMTAGVESVGVVAVTVYFYWTLADLLRRRHEEFTPEQPDVAWIVSGEAAVLGLLAAVGSMNLRSGWRLAGVLLIAAAGGVFYLWQPPTESTLPVPVDWQMGVLRPLTVGVIWLGLASIVAYGVSRPLRLWAWDPVRAIRALTLALAAGATFTYFNVVEPRLGVMREVWAIDRDSGEVDWRAGVAAPSGRKYAQNTYATPTPVSNGSIVVADFGPVMLALSTRGEIVWTREEPLYMEYLRYGAVRSPVIHGDTVIYLYLPENPDVESGELTGRRAYLAALDLATGDEVWRVDGIEGGHDSYGSPLLVPTDDGGVAVVIAVYDHAHAYDADTGARLWSFEAPMAHPVPSPVADDRRVYVGGGLYGPQLAAGIDLGPFAAGGAGRPWANREPSRLKAGWKTNRQTPDIGSLLVYQGLVYWVTSDGRMFCHDAETGEVVWRHRLSGTFEPSPVAGDGKLYVQASDGRTLVLAAGSKFELLSENRLHGFEGSHASIAIAGGSLFVRGRNALFAVGGS